MNPSWIHHLLRTIRQFDNTIIACWKSSRSILRPLPTTYGPHPNRANNKHSARSVSALSILTLTNVLLSNSSYCNYLLLPIERNKFIKKMSKHGLFEPKLVYMYFYVQATIRIEVYVFHDNCPTALCNFLYLTIIWRLLPTVLLSF